MIPNLKRSLIITLAILTITSAACTDNQIKTIATNVDRAGLLVMDAFQLKEELENQSVIDGAQSKRISQGLLKVNTALKVFNAKAKSYADAGALTPAGKADLKKLSTDIADAISELVSNGTFGVKNPDQQSRINSVISALKQAALTIVDTVTLLKTKGA